MTCPDCGTRGPFPYVAESRLNGISLICLEKQQILAGADFRMERRKSHMELLGDTVKILGAPIFHGAFTAMVVHRFPHAHPALGRLAATCCFCSFLALPFAGRSQPPYRAGLAAFTDIAIVVLLHIPLAYCLLSLRGGSENRAPQDIPSEGRTSDQLGPGAIPHGKAQPSLRGIGGASLNCLIAARIEWVSLPSRLEAWTLEIGTRLEYRPDVYIAPKLRRLSAT